MQANPRTDGFRVVFGEAHAVGVGHHLVGDHNRDAELLRQTRQLPQKLSQMHLPAKQQNTKQSTTMSPEFVSSIRLTDKPLRELPSTAVVRAIERSR